MREMKGTYYKADDGKIFMEKNECIKHEFYKTFEDITYDDLNILLSQKEKIINLLSQYKENK